MTGIYWHAIGAKQDVFPAFLHEVTGASELVYSAKSYLTRM